MDVVLVSLLLNGKFGHISHLNKQIIAVRGLICMDIITNQSMMLRRTINGTTIFFLSPVEWYIATQKV